jgi:transposase-like protein
VFLQKIDLGETSGKLLEMLSLHILIMHHYQMKVNSCNFCSNRTRMFGDLASDARFLCPSFHQTLTQDLSAALPRFGDHVCFQPLFG